jgi:predicted S18 family serine protease
MGKKWGILIIILLLLLPVVLADESRQGRTKLLAIINKDGSQFGTAATLDLDIQPGKERVFLETFPLTQISTQVSVRFAQQMACSELDIDCSNYDFFYTIRALPGVVGGPSAGAAAAILTSALILDRPIRQDVAITGTINSGGIIGAVGGIKGKIKAASENGIKHVLIPKGTRMLAGKTIADVSTNSTNLTIDKNASRIDLVEYGKNLSINVSEVATLAEALEIFTGYKIEEPDINLIIDAAYNQTMKEVSEDLCSRNQEIINTLSVLRKDLKQNDSKKELEALNYSNMSKVSFKQNEFYSAASYCFRSSVMLKQIIFKNSNFSKEEIQNRSDILMDELAQFEKKINHTDIDTITDLQTMMAVRERINEVKNSVDKTLKESNDTTNAGWLAYAEERLYSAKSWSKFFNGGSAEFDLDTSKLKLSCQSKITEAEERYNYLKTILPNLLPGTKKNIEKAYKELDNEQYVSCLYQAIKTKSEVDVILGLIGVEEERLDELLELKLDIVKKALVKTQQKGIFPIISYPYYEYANSLKDVDESSAFLFSEYALEFANLDIYFPPKEKTLLSFLQKIDKKILIIFILGIAAGILLMWKPKDKRYKKNKTLQTPPKKRLRGKKR